MTINMEKPYVVGMDIGGTNTVFGVVDSRGNVLASDSVKTQQYDNIDDYVDAVCKKLLPLLSQFGGAEKIKGMGVGAPNGNYYSGTIEFAPNLPWKGIIPLASMFEERLGIPTALTNDANAAAIGEMTYGAARGMKDFIMITLGTGVGSGIVINGHVHRGKDLSAGELSYFFADTLTRKDVDKIFDIDSISDMEEEYEKLPYLWSTSYSTRAFCYQVAVAKGINPKEFNGELLYKMAEEGDPVVLDMLEDFYFTTAKYLFNIFAIVDPDIILLGGGISAQPAFVEGVKRYVEKLKSISMITNFIKVDVCKFGNDSNLLGALYSFRQMYLEN